MLREMKCKTINTNTKQRLVETLLDFNKYTDCQVEELITSEALLNELNKLDKIKTKNSINVFVKASSVTNEYLHFVNSLGDIHQLKENDVQKRYELTRVTSAYELNYNVDILQNTPIEKQQSNVSVLWGQCLSTNESDTFENENTLKIVIEPTLSEMYLVSVIDNTKTIKRLCSFEILPSFIQEIIISKISHNLNIREPIKQRETIIYGLNNFTEPKLKTGFAKSFFNTNHMSLAIQSKFGSDFVEIKKMINTRQTTGLISKSTPISPPEHKYRPLSVILPTKSGRIDLSGLRNSPDFLIERPHRKTFQKTPIQKEKSCDLIEHKTVEKEEKVEISKEVKEQRNEATNPVVTEQNVMMHTTNVARKKFVGRRGQINTKTTESLIK
ncbi:hypothetical protein EIN_068490 [Entamoeba invadens IP1]|uniref:Uncharacterized protein n=1 Tax=Entamoeba invadens IP1 TaxID=370355 RepID=A0A0A1TUB8_ENTIV|nr:hypothetical protein EIN_068490 [Entamoeba invadens IP1]ELP83545.1 hypothetical protein EIN_068490 [Entamoeba invadens IP1]|eukprot:XP_004182891.1 hypothetical protein EIN_068490 [Entamoeba invadens IP1]